MFYQAYYYYYYYGIYTAELLLYMCAYDYECYHHHVSFHVLFYLTNRAEEEEEEKEKKTKKKILTDLRLTETRNVEDCNLQGCSEECRARGPKTACRIVVRSVADSAGL